MNIFPVGPNSIKLPRYKKRCQVRTARGLLHVMRHDNDRKLLFELINQRFHFCRGNRIQRGTRLIHQDDFRPDRQRSCNAEALLLAPGKPKSALL